MLLTIAICTHNRSPLLEKCLRGFENQSAAGNFVLMVVDNNSIDNTPEVASDFCSRNPHFRYLKEAEIGLSKARNRALSECATEYIGFVDDDAIPVVDFVAIALRTIKTSKYAVFGGGQIPIVNRPIPNWFPEVVVDDSETKILTDEFLNGFNIFFSRQQLQRVGGFSSKIGMSGKKIAYGEETLAQLQIRKNGGVTVYISGLLVHHLIDDYKLTLSWQLKSAYAMGRDYWITFSRRVSFRDRVYLFRNAFVKLIKAIFQVDFSDSGKRQLNWFKIFQHFFFDLGRVFGKGFSS